LIPLYQMMNQGTMAVAEKLYITPMGCSTVRPNDALPPIDRRAVLQNAHVIARRYRAACGGSNDEALSYGLKAAGGNGGSPAQSNRFNAQVAKREFTAAEIAASRTATRRCGSSYLPM
jgi:hypothetical protein